MFIMLHKVPGSELGLSISIKAIERYVYMVAQFIMLYTFVLT